MAGEINKLLRKKKWCNICSFIHVQMYNIQTVTDITETATAIKITLFNNNNNNNKKKKNSYHHN